LPIQKLSPNFEASVGVEANNYQYYGKELNDDFGLHWMDYGARWYDVQINRWGQIDPLAEKYYDWNGYNYVLGNPVKFIDPFGLTPNIYYSSTGRYLGEDDDQENDNIRIIDTDLFRDMQTLSGHEDNSIRSDLGMAYSMSLNRALKSGNLNLEGFSNILTNEISLLSEVDVSYLLNGKVTVFNLSKTYHNNGTEEYITSGYNYLYDENGRKKSVIPNLTADESFRPHIGGNEFVVVVAQIEFMQTNLLTTRSDIQSLLGIHEFYSHGILGLTNIQHTSVYQIVSNHSTWQSVTPQMKKNYDKKEYQPK